MASRRQCAPNHRLPLLYLAFAHGSMWLAVALVAFWRHRGWIILAAVALHTLSTVRTLRANASSREPVTQI